MGSFGATDSREKSPVYATHSPEIAIGFVWENESLASFGDTASTPDWLRLGKPARAGRRHFSDQIVSKLVLASFGETDSREMPPVYATHSPEIANGFVW
jgi:hypothetical protein